VLLSLIGVYFLFGTAVTFAGTVVNRSSKVLWVVENDSGAILAHRLPPGFKSPPGTDADGFRAVDGTPTDGHTAWVKVLDISTAKVTDAKDGTLKRGCLACFDVSDHAFRPATYAPENWGVPIKRRRRR
jgi:hypothetical protein